MGDDALAHVRRAGQHCAHAYRRTLAVPMTGTRQPKDLEKVREEIVKAQDELRAAVELLNERAGPT